MKISVTAIVVLAVLCGTACTGILYQRSNQQQLSQAVQIWQNKVATANLIGKSPHEALAFLNHQGAHCEPYYSGEVIDDANKTKKKMGFVTGRAGPAAHTFSVDGLQTWYITIGFNFDSHDKCQSSIVTWGPHT